jgi:hypothetical protein
MAKFRKNGENRKAPSRPRGPVGFSANHSAVPLFPFAETILPKKSLWFPIAKTGTIGRMVG